MGSRKLINQEIYIDYRSQWIISAWQHISPEVTVKVLKCCICNASEGTDDKLWNSSEEDGNIRNECQE
jgi:hypothetical protein